MKPIFYEIERNLRSKFILFMIVAIVGLTSLLAYESSVSFTSRSVFQHDSFESGYYVNGSNITLVFYAYNQYGNPAKEATVQFTYNNITYTPTFDSRGIAKSTFIIDTNKMVEINDSFSYSSLGTSYSQNGKLLINPEINYSGYSVQEGVVERSNSSNYGFIVMYVGPNDTSMPPSVIYLGNSTSKTIPIVPMNNHSFEFNTSGAIVETFFPSVTISQENNTYVLWIENKSGAVQRIDAYGAESNFTLVGHFSTYTPVTTSRVQNLVFSDVSTILGLFIPILGIFAAYLTYGKDRTSGVLESVLKRPVTRGSLISTRFAANAIAIGGAIALSVIFTDVIMYHYLGVFMTGGFVTEIFWTFLIQGIAFIALVYMASHVVKSQGALLGISISLFIVFDLFWGVFPVITSLILGIPLGSSDYAVLATRFDFASPSGYGSLMQILVTNTASGLPVAPASLGVTWASFILTGILWSMVPFVFAYYLARTRD